MELEKAVQDKIEDPKLLKVKADTKTRVYNRAFEEAIKGDHSFGNVALLILMLKLAKKEELTKYESDVLVWFLCKIKDSKQGLNIICGVDKKRGAGKKGAKAMDIASKVLATVAENKKRGKTVNMETIWAKVAQSESVSESAVKKAWMQWKDKVQLDLKGIMDYYLSDEYIETEEIK